MKICIKLALFLCFGLSVNTASATTILTGKWRLEINDINGKANIYKSDVLLISNSQCAFKIEDQQYYQEQFNLQNIHTTDYSDNFGTGKQIQILAENQARTIQLTQIYNVYNDKDFILTSFSLESSDTLRSNYMAPVYSTTPTAFLPSTNNRALFVPFDNDKWVRYNSNNFGSTVTSYEVGALYNPDTRNGLILGSIEHTTWKTGIVYVTDAVNSVQNIKVYGGITSSETRDLLPHGKIVGHKITSPLVFVGYFDDWRSGMETYADANAVIAPKLPWSGGRPFIWNSWGVLQTNVSYANATEVADYIYTNLEPNNFQNDSTVYIDLDSYWSNITYSGLLNFSRFCVARKQKSGIYWTPFVDWSNDPNRLVEGQTNVYYRDLYLYANGVPQKIAGACALDPTNPYTKARAELYLNRFKQQGFKFLKLDFMTHGSLEADKYYDPNVHTGIQAYNQGLQHLVNYLGNSMFLNFSIAPLFPSNYGNGRRIACDAYGSIGDTEYTLNSLTYGWWLDHVYSYNDADNVVLNGFSTTENKARVTSSVITGIFCIGDDYSTTGPQNSKDRAAVYLVNPEINRIARNCKAFKPVEGGTGSVAADMFTYKLADTTYVATFNYTLYLKTNTYDFNRLGLISGTSYTVKELWSNTITERSDSWSEITPRRDVVVYKIYPKTDTEVSQIDKHSGFTIYPVPTAGKLYWKSTTDLDLKAISICSLTGAKMFNFENPGRTIDVSGLNSGVYLLSAILNSGEILTRKFLKK